MTSSGRRTRYDRWAVSWADWVTLLLVGAAVAIFWSRGQVSDVGAIGWVLTLMALATRVVEHLVHVRELVDVVVDQDAA